MREYLSMYEGVQPQQNVPCGALLLLPLRVGRGNCSRFGPAPRRARRLADRACEKSIYLDRSRSRTRPPGSVRHVVGGCCLLASRVKQRSRAVVSCRTCPILRQFISSQRAITHLYAGWRQVLHRTHHGAWWHVLLHGRVTRPQQRRLLIHLCNASGGDNSVEVICRYYYNAQRSHLLGLYVRRRIASLAQLFNALIVHAQFLIEVADSGVLEQRSKYHKETGAEVNVDRLHVRYFWHL